METDQFPANLYWSFKYSVITSDFIKSFDIYIMVL